MIYYLLCRPALNYEFPFYITKDFKILENRIKNIVKDEYTITLFKTTSRYLNGWYSKTELGLK